MVARAPSRSTVFQFRPVVRVPSFASMTAFVKRERPIPFGKTMYACLPAARTTSGPRMAACNAFTSLLSGASFRNWTTRWLGSRRGAVDRRHRHVVEAEVDAELAAMMDEMVDVGAHDRL